MAEKNGQRSDALRVAAEKRVELKQALSQVESAAASPAGEVGWREQLIGALEKLQGSLSQHVEEVEATDGLLAELATLAPRLVNQIGHVRDEHPVLCRQVAGAIELARSRSDVEQVRAEVLDTLSAIASHRQKGADLVYEGYNVDIGSG